MNAYMLYANSIRASVREENPDLAMGEVAKEIGTRYKAMGDEEKAKWQAKADKAKEAYKKELAEYEKSNPKKADDKKPKAKKKVEEQKKKKKKAAPEPEPASSEEDSDDSDDDSGDSDDSDDSD